jgi:hypothetical protein
MTSFVALYRGDNIREAKMIAVTGDPKVVAHVVAELLDAPEQHPETTDPVLKALNSGRHRALRLIKVEAR